MSFDEVAAALTKVQAGDIGICRTSGVASNLAIPGFMKHAFIHINSPLKATRMLGEAVYDTADLQIVEATHLGVIKRHALYPLYTDYAIVLRPKNVTSEDVEKAVSMAVRLVGYEYDSNFHFNIEESLHDIEGNVVSNLSSGHKLAFSCTETVAASWWHKQHQLRLYRSKHRGKMVILADDFISNAFEIVWLSDSVTVESAKELGLHEQGISMIEEYRKRHPVLTKHLP